MKKTQRHIVYCTKPLKLLCIGSVLVALAGILTYRYPSYFVHVHPRLATRSGVTTGAKIDQTPYFFNDRSSEINGSTTNDCTDFQTVVTFIQSKLKQPFTVSNNGNNWYDFGLRWRRSINEPFIDYPIVKGVSFINNNDAVDGKYPAGDLTAIVVHQVDVASKAISATFPAEAAKLGLMKDSLNTSAPYLTTPDAHFSMSDQYLRVLGYKKGNDLYSITIQANESAPQAVPGSNISIVCGVPNPLFDRIFDILHFSANTTVQKTKNVFVTSYFNDYVAIYEMSADRSVFGIVGDEFTKRVPIVNYYHLENDKATLIDSGSNYPSCVKLQELHIGKGMKCSDEHQNLVTE